MYTQLKHRYYNRVKSLFKNNTNTEVDSSIDMFFRFIALKAVYGNNTGSDLSPDFTTDSVWHRVILDTELYRDIESTCGRKIPHFPNREYDPEDLKTKRRLLALFLNRRVFDGFRVPPKTVSRAYGIDRYPKTGFDQFREFSKDIQNKFAVNLGYDPVTNTTMGC